MSIVEYRQTLWANGFRPVPVKSKQKAPSGTGWTDDARKSPPPCAGPDAKSTPWAQSTGILCDGLQVIDIDIDDADTVAGIEQAVQKTLGTGPVRIRAGSPRKLIVFRAAEGEPRKRILKGTRGKIEILGHGQQFVAAGTHPDGDDYAWDGADLTQVRRDDLVAVTDRQIDALFAAAAPIIGAEVEKPKPAPAPAPRAAQPVRDAGARERAFAETALERNADELGAAQQGGRNNTLNAISYRLGRLIGAGWLSQSEVEATLDDAAGACGLVKDDGIRSVRKTMRSGIEAGIADPHPPLETDDDENIVPAGHSFVRQQVDPETGEVLEEAGDEDDEDDYPPEPETDVPAECPADLLQVPGLVGEITQWINDASNRPIPLFALGAALTVVGALVGRRVLQAETETACHTYMVLVAGVGAGKDWPGIFAPRLLLDAAGAQTIDGKPIWTSSVSSAASIATGIQARPLMVQTVDEIDKLLMKGASRSSSNQELNMINEYCTLWSTTLGSYAPESTTTRSDVVIARPHVSLIGGTTPIKFANAMKSYHSSGGFLSRCLVLSIPKRTMYGGAPKARKVVPEALAAKVKALWGFTSARTEHGMAGNMTPGWLSPADAPEPVYVPMTPDAFRLYEATIREQDVLLADTDDPDNKDAEPAQNYARWAETALRLAMIVAIGRYANQPGLKGVQIEATDYDWASRFVRWTQSRLVQRLRMTMSENSFQSMTKRILNVIRGAGEIRRSDLLSRLGQEYSIKAIDEAIKTLAEAKNIKAGTKRTGRAAGRPAVTYRFVRR